MRNCLECFCESGLDGRELQKLVDGVFPAFACEQERCSQFSPKPVEDGEEIAFILIDPLHYDEARNVIVPEAFRELTTRDLSTLRVSHATSTEAEAVRDQLIRRGADQITPKLRLVNEVCIASVSEVRSELDNGARLLAVYDTALEEIPAHASIFTRHDVLESRKLRKVVRNRIHKIMSKRRTPFADFIASLASSAAA